MNIKALRAKIAKAPDRPAGTMLVFKRTYVEDAEGKEVVFITLEPRPSGSDTGTLCLIVTGNVRGKAPGDIARLNGIIDLSKEVT